MNPSWFHHGFIIIVKKVGYFSGEVWKWMSLAGRFRFKTQRGEKEVNVYENPIERNAGTTMTVSTGTKSIHAGKHNGKKKDSAERKDQIGLHNQFIYGVREEADRSGQHANVNSTVVDDFANLQFAIIVLNSGPELNLTKALIILESIGFKPSFVRIVDIL
jgi:hypothetical protein